MSKILNSWYGQFALGALAAVVVSILLIHELEHIGIIEVIRQMFGGQ